jgi:DNA-binding LytR/AlgR family response regulator
MNINQNLRLLLLEDNPGFIQLLKILLNDIGLTHIKIAQTYKAALSAYEQFKPDICILDIGLGNESQSGIKVAEYIRAKQKWLPIIYLTSHYTEDHYQLTRHTNPSGFFSKELSKFKLEQAIDIAIMHRQEVQSVTALTHKKEEVSVFSQQQCFFKIGDVYKAIPLKDVVFFYADNKLTYARVGSRNYPTNIQLKTLEDEFNTTFARIHKTYLVNVEHINAIYPKDSSRWRKPADWSGLSA